MNFERFINKFCIVRCHDAGVHAGFVQQINERTVELAEARRLWYWVVPMGAGSFLSGVATAGIDKDKSKIGEPVDILLTDACEIIPCSDRAEASIRDAPIVPRTQ